MRYLTIRLPLLALLVALGAALLGPSAQPTAAAPIACSTFLQPYVDWAKQPGSEQLGFHYGSFTLVSNQANGVVGYTEQGRLLYRPPTQGSPAALLTPQAFAGAQYFNDRRQGGYPFDPARQDRLGLTINAQTGEVTLQLLSWGGSLMNVTPQCENGVMYGFGNTPGIKRLFVISLGKGIYHP